MRDSLRLWGNYGHLSFLFSLVFLSVGKWHCKHVCRCACHLQLWKQLPAEISCWPSFWDKHAHIELAFNAVHSNSHVFSAKQYCRHNLHSTYLIFKTWGIHPNVCHHFSLFFISMSCHSSSCHSSHISGNRDYNILTAEGTAWVLFQICWAAPDGNSLLLGKAEVSVEGMMISVWMAFKIQIETSLPTKWHHVSM